VHADSNIEAGQPMPGLNFEFHGVGFGEECQPAPHGALCIVLLHRLRAERGEDTVPGVLKDLSEVRFDDCGEATEGPVDKGAQLFRVQMATQIGGSHQVQEEHADLLDDLLVCTREVRAGVVREYLESSTDRPDDGFEDRFAQEEPLSLQELKRGLQSLRLF